MNVIKATYTHFLIISFALLYFILYFIFMFTCSLSFSGRIKTHQMFQVDLLAEWICALSPTLRLPK